MAVALRLPAEAQTAREPVPVPHQTDLQTTEEVLLMAKLKTMVKNLSGRKGKALRGITGTAIAIQALAVALIIVVEMADLMKDRELDLEKIGIKKASRTRQRPLKAATSPAEEEETKEKTETDARI